MAQIGRSNVRKQFLPEIDSGIVDLFDGPLGPAAEVNRFAATIVFSRFPSDPPSAFQPMQQTDQCRFFDIEATGDLSLGKWRFGPIQVQKGAPFGLAESERFKPLIELEPPSPGDAMEERTKTFGLGLHKSLAC